MKESLCLDGETHAELMQCLDAEKVELLSFILKKTAEKAPFTGNKSILRLIR